MAYIVKKGTVRHNGKSYAEGKEIPDLTESQAKRLTELKVIEEDNNAVSAPEDYDFETPEEFAKLKAEDQKERLVALKIDPAGKSEERIAQYEEWYEGQDAASFE